MFRRARGSGALNLSSQSLAEIPSQVFALAGNYFRKYLTLKKANSGSLQLTKNLIPASFLHAENLDADEKFWEVVELTKVDLSYNEITSIPPTIEALALSLRSFKARDNKLVSLPREFFALVNLTHLDLAGYVVFILYFSKSLGVLGKHVLSEAAICYFYSNEIESIEGIGSMSGLKELVLSNNRLKELPNIVVRSCLTRKTNISRGL